MTVESYENKKKDDNAIEIPKNPVPMSDRATHAIATNRRTEVLISIKVYFSRIIRSDIGTHVSMHMLTCLRGFFYHQFPFLYR